MDVDGLTPDAVVGTLNDAIERHRSLIAGPRQGSEAYRAGRTSLGRHSWDLSCTRLTIGLDHVSASIEMARLEGRTRPFMHFTLLRTAFEGAVLARWVCKPGLTPMIRLRRGAGAQWEDLEERRKFEEIRNRRPKPATYRRQKLPRVRARMRQQQLDAALARRGAGDRIVPPPITALFEEFALVRGGGEWIYRVLGAAAHTQQWAALSLGVPSILPGTEKGSRQSPHRALVAGSDEGVFMATALAVLAVRSAIADVERYGGLVTADTHAGEQTHP